MANLSNTLNGLPLSEEEKKKKTIEEITTNPVPITYQGTTPKLSDDLSGANLPKDTTVGKSLLDKSLNLDTASPAPAKAEDIPSDASPLEKALLFTGTQEGYGVGKGMGEMKPVSPLSDALEYDGPKGPNTLTAPTPIEYKAPDSSKLDALAKEASTAISSKGDRSTLASEFKSAIENARKDYLAAKERLGIGEAAEMFGKALAQIGAGMYGMRTGIDAVTGVNFNVSDWSKRYEREMADYKQRISEASDTYAAKREDLSKDVQERSADISRKMQIAEAQDRAATHEADMKYNAQVQNAANFLRTQEFNANAWNSFDKETRDNALRLELKRMEEDAKVKIETVKARLKKEERAGKLSDADKIAYDKAGQLWVDDVKKVGEAVYKSKEGMAELAGLDDVDVKTRNNKLIGILGKIQGGYDVNVQELWDKTDPSVFKGQIPTKATHRDLFLSELNKLSNKEPKSFDHYQSLTQPTKTMDNQAPAGVQSTTGNTTAPAYPSTATTSPTNLPPVAEGRVRMRSKTTGALVDVPKNRVKDAENDPKDPHEVVQ